MTAGDGSAASTAEHRQRLIEDFTQRLGKYLPESGEPKPWKLAETELALVEDMNELARGIIESRIGVDPLRYVEKLRCPDCSRALGGVKREAATHKQTLFGPIRYSRSYGTCQACGLAFSPSGEKFRLRHGLL